jgi:hypothetical protein
MKDIRKKQREVRRKIIRDWMRLPREKRQSQDDAVTFATVAARENAAAFMHGRRGPYARVLAWLLPRAGGRRTAIR